MKTLIISLASLGTAMGISTNFLAATKIVQSSSQSESLLIAAPTQNCKMKVYWDQKNTAHHDDLIFDSNFDWSDRKDTGYKFFYHEIQISNKIMPVVNWKPLNDNGTAETKARRWVGSPYPPIDYTGTPFDALILDPSNFTKFQTKDLMHYISVPINWGIWTLDYQKILDFANIEMQSAGQFHLDFQRLSVTLKQVIGISIFNRDFGESTESAQIVAIFGFQKWENWYGNSHLNLGTGIEIEYQNA